MARDPLSRVAFREGAPATPDDLVASDAFHAQNLRRHRLAAHGWGVLAGLGITPGPDGLTIGAGIAIDGYGREIVLPAARPVDTTLFFGLAARELDLWIAFADGNDRDGRAELVYTAAAGPVDPERPPGVPQEDLAREPFDPPPPDPRPWPVYLGRIRHDPAARQAFAAETAGRREAGVRAEWIEAPSGGARLAVGSVEGDVNGRFAVLLGGEAVLAVDAEGTVRTGGDLDVGGVLELGEGLAFRGPASDTRPEAPSLAFDPANENILELALPEGGAFVVGAHRDGTFSPILTVAAEGVVRIDGRLVEAGVPPGQLDRAGVAPELGTGAQNLANAARFSGLVSGASEVLAGSAASPTEIAETIVAALLDDSVLRAAFWAAAAENNLPPDDTGPE
jgi:hypothetical protein